MFNFDSVSYSILPKNVKEGLRMVLKDSKWQVGIRKISNTENTCSL